MTIKYICYCCKIEKYKEEFYRRIAAPDYLRGGRQSMCKQCYSIKNKDSTKEWKENKNRIRRKSDAKLKKEILIHYSSGLLKCNCCGESNYNFLTLDHIDSSGNEHRRKIKGGGYAVYRDIRKQNYPLGYQILCYNCNCGRAHNNGACPHTGI